MADFEFVDMRKEYNKEMLVEFYNGMMVPNFGRFKDELEDLQVWVDLLENQKSDGVVLHVILAVERGDGGFTILGGCACEYYRGSNCGLLTYIAVDPAYRSKGISTHIVREVIAALNEDAVREGKAEGLSGMFLETNDAAKVSSDKDVIDPLVRHKILNRLGFSLLDFQYVQPALSPEQENCSDLLLAVHKDFLKDTPDDVSDGDSDDADDGADERRKHFDSSVILGFMREFFSVLRGEASLHTDADFLAIEKELTHKRRTLALN